MISDYWGDNRCSSELLSELKRKLKPVKNLSPFRYTCLHTLISWKWNESELNCEDEIKTLTCSYIYIYIYIWSDEFRVFCLWRSMYVCQYVFINLFVKVCIYLCACIYMPVCEHYIDTRGWIFEFLAWYKHTYIHTYIYTYTHTFCRQLYTHKRFFSFFLCSST